STRQMSPAPAAAARHRKAARKRAVRRGQASAGPTSGDSRRPSRAHPTRSGGALALDESDDVGDGIQVLRNHFLVGNLEAVGVFQMVDQLQDAGGIDDALLHQRIAVGKEVLVVGEQVVLQDEEFDFVIERHQLAKSLSRSMVERIPTNAMLSENPMARPAAHLASNRVTAEGSK